jgi:hypothetical protein
MSGNAFLLLVTWRHFFTDKWRRYDRRCFALEQIPRLVVGKLLSLYGDIVSIGRWLYVESPSRAAFCFGDLATGEARHPGRRTSVNRQVVSRTRPEFKKPSAEQLEFLRDIDLGQRWRSPCSLKRCQCR